MKFNFSTETRPVATNIPFPASLSRGAYPFRYYNSYTCNAKIGKVCHVCATAILGLFLFVTISGIPGDATVHCDGRESTRMVNSR